MSLTVDVLPVEPLSMVRLVVDLPAGSSWRVTGRSGDTEWLAGEGTSSGRETALSDPWAPLGRAVEYVLTAAGGESWGAGPVVRVYRGEHALTDLTGRVVAGFRWAPGDPWGPQPRASFLDPWGSSLPVPVVGPTAGAGGGAVVAKTTGDHTRTLEQLVARNRPLLLHHNAHACQMPDCDVPPVRTIMLTGAEAERSGRTDVAERIWSLSYRLVPRPHAYLAPVATWVDDAAAFPIHADRTATGLSYAELARGDWLVS